MTTKDISNFFWAVVTGALLMLALFGWINNIVLLITDSPYLGGFVLARALGVIFFPLGCVLGWIS
jgi:hypothetical protein